MCELYIGLRAPKDFVGLHIPFIQVLPIPGAVKTFEDATHLIITSQTTLQILGGTPNIPHFCVGKKTASLLPADYEVYLPQVETAEGLVEMLKSVTFENGSKVFWPRSSGARPVIVNYFKTIDAELHVIDLYDTAPIAPEELPDLKKITKVFFTSPTTVHSFFSIYRTGVLPALEAIGPITQATLDSYLVKKAQWAKTGEKHDCKT